MSNRASGILLHPSSLPGNYGIGTLGLWSRRWVDFLVESGQSIWQVLPLGPTSYGDSPYQSFSAHAGNPSLIDLDLLMEEGLLSQELLGKSPPLPPDKVSYGAMHNWKRPLLHLVAKAFSKHASKEQVKSYKAFVKENASWLEDYALFMAIKEHHEFVSWQEWPEELKCRKKSALKAFQKEHKEALEIQKLCQWFFFDQWDRLKEYANEQGVQILGDIPIFVALDSADAWCHPEMFQFDKKLAPKVVAGVPPDYFSEDGQLWGNPLYDWAAHKKDKYGWWFARLESSLRLYDQLRLDHFRGFSAYWEVPADADTARGGRWVEGPGSHFFKALFKKFPDLKIIAEDLGDISPEVNQLRDEFELPGMLVLQFAFGGDAKNKFLPHNHERNYVVYSGTHDNDTTQGWYFNSSRPEERDMFRSYTGATPKNVGNAMIRATLSSVAQTAILPFQDVLGLGSEARMNVPSEGDGNWQWRFLEQQFTREIAIGLREITEATGRVNK